MRRLAVLALLVAPPAWPLSQEAREFMSITRELEPVHCEKRKLRREIALAQVEKKDTSELRKRFAALDRDAKTERLEKRLGQLEPRLANSPDPEDLTAINRQRTEAFYRCD